ncbi:MAG: hypothetical protein K5662_05320 [Lachnospiraceae bacterium]|nr:hypothetical protein [Lachnospiraceae bacterium]
MDIKDIPFDAAKNSVDNYLTWKRFVDRQKHPDSCNENEYHMEEDMVMYSCSSCGGQFMTIGTTVSTRCPYCNQPVVLKDRIAQEELPSRIIPFKLTKDQAYKKLKKSFKHSAYIPQEIKHFTIDHMQGVYLPFFHYLADWDMDNAYLGTKPSKVIPGKDVAYREHWRKRIKFNKLFIYAASKLDWSNVHQLPPFDLDEIRPFHPAYLAGYVADVKTTGIDQMAYEARLTALWTFMRFMDLLPEIEMKDPVLESSVNVVKDERLSYILVPAWIISFKYQGKMYPMMVNGQTGKVVGTLPWNKRKARAWFWTLGIILTALLSFLTGGLYYLTDKLCMVQNVKSMYSFVGLFEVLSISCGFVFAILALGNVRELRFYERLTQNENVEEYVKEREFK